MAPPPNPLPMREGEHSKTAYVGFRPRGEAWVSSALLAAFIVVTLVVAQGVTERFDGTLLLWMQMHLSPRLDGFWQIVSWPGYGPQSYGVSVIFVALGWWARGRRGLVLMLLALLASPIGSLVKHLVNRPRPTPEQARVIGELPTSASYPSGHVVAYTVLCGMLIVLILSALPARARERRRDWAICVILALLIVLVGPARIALGQHWPMDVVGGYLLGGALLGLLARWRHAAPPRPATPEDEE